MNLQIHHVISNITGVTGLAMLDAILNGERNPKKNAALKDRRIKADNRALVKSLDGDYRQMIRDCDVEIEKYLTYFESRIDLQENPLPNSSSSRRKPQGNEPNFDLRSRLYRILGTELTQIDGTQVTTAQMIFAELGLEISKFSAANGFCSWPGLCSNNKINGGKVLSFRTRPGPNRVAQTLRMAA